MTNSLPFSTDRHALPSCMLRALKEKSEAEHLGSLLANMSPWRTLGYSDVGLCRYLLRPDPALHRYAVLRRKDCIGVICVRYPWLRGACIELLAVDPLFQSMGVGRDIVRWVEEELRGESQNVWVLASEFNEKARAFYKRMGFEEIAPLQDLVKPGYAEILLRKRIKRDSS